MRNGGTMANASQARRLTVEPLESRTLLSVTVVTTTSSSGTVASSTTTAATPLSGSISTAVKSSDFSNVTGTLGQLYSDYRKFRNAGGTSKNFNSSAYSSLLIDEDQVAVNVRTNSNLTALTSVLRGLGGTTLARSKSLGVSTVSLSISQLHSLALSRGVAGVTPVYRPVLNQEGSSNNQADQLEQVDTARTTYGLDGTGTKVGVLSDTVDQVGQGLAQSVATGDLPDNVQVIQDGYSLPTDEGRGMLELVHDLAPNAALAFATAGEGQLDMAQNIRALRASGANVLVDDIQYFDDPAFEPGVIEDAINDVTADGATYFSSAGNYGNNGYNTSLSYTTVNGKRAVDFDLSSDTNPRLQFTTKQAGTMVIQWDNPYNGVTGNVSTDFDATIYNNHYTNRVVAQDLTDNIATEQPVIIMQVPAASTYQLELDVAQRLGGSALPRHLKIAFIGGTDNVFSTEYSNDTNNANIYGHTAGPNTISIGAVDAAAASLFADGTSTTLASEDFTSKGPAVRYFDANGKRLAEAVTINKPDLSGVDGVNTSFFPADQGSTDGDSLPNFFGTSAAAPDVAAIAALIYQADPSAKSSQIRQALQGTATALNGVNSQDYDPFGGAGLANATLAVGQFVSNPTVQIEPVATTATPTDSIKIVFSQQVQNFDISDLILTVDGSENLLTGDNVLTTDDGGRTYLIPNLAEVTNVPGDYTLSLTDETGITNLTGLPLALTGSKTINFTQATTTIPASPVASAASSALKALSNTAIQVRFDDKSDDETGFTLQRSTTSDFSDAVKTFQLGESTSFTDDSLAPSTTYYYRVRSFNFAGVSRFASLGSATTLATGEVVLDNESSRGVTNHGFVSRSTATGFLGSNYLDDNNTGKGDKSVTFTASTLTAGEYFVYIRYPAASNNATNVPVTITSGGHSKTITLNERKGGDGYVLLGKFDLSSIASLKISNIGTNGHVVADGVRFLPTSGD